MVSAHGGSGIGKVTDEGIASFDLDGDSWQGSFAQHVHAVVLGGAPINPCHGGHVIEGRELGKQGIVALTGEAVWSRGILHGLIMRNHVVDVDHVTAQFRVSHSFYRLRGFGSRARSWKGEKGM